MRRLWKIKLLHRQFLAMFILFRWKCAISGKISSSLHTFIIFWTIFIGCFVTILFRFPLYFLHLGALILKTKIEEKETNLIKFTQKVSIMSIYCQLKCVIHEISFAWSMKSENKYEPGTRLAPLAHSIRYLWLMLREFCGMVSVTFRMMLWIDAVGLMLKWFSVVLVLFGHLLAAFHPLRIHRRWDNDAATNINPFQNRADKIIDHRAIWTVRLFAMVDNKCSIQSTLNERHNSVLASPYRLAELGHRIADIWWKTFYKCTNNTVEYNWQYLTIIWWHFFHFTKYWIHKMDFVCMKRFVIYIQWMLIKRYFQFVRINLPILSFSFRHFSNWMFIQQRLNAWVPEKSFHSILVKKKITKISYIFISYEILQGQ